MTNKIKLEHYVPQFYLRNFSIKNYGKNVYCFDKHTSSKFIADIGNIACEKHFYDFPKGSQSIEKNMAKIESALAVAYRKLVSSKDLYSLNWDERISMATLVAIQEIRTKEMREFLRDMIRQFTAKLSKHKLSKEIRMQLERINSAEYPREFQIRMFKSVKEFSDIILSMKWILIENKTETLYWTSDHPINRFNPIKSQPPLGNLGYLSRGIQIFFPLTPRLSLCLCDLVEYFDYPEKIKTDNVDNIIFQNHLQLRWSTRFIFSQDDDFSLAEKILKEEPSLKRIDRKRISVY